MKKIILKKPQPNVIYLDDVDENKPVFAKLHGNLAGMIVKEKSGWILRIGNSSGCSGHHSTLRKCIESGSEYGYMFYVES
jgi:hypothetical protein